MIRAEVARKWPGKEEKTYDNFFDLYEFLETLFDKKVDLITTASLSPYIGPDILKEVEYIEIAA